MSHCAVVFSEPEPEDQVLEGETAKARWTICMLEKDHPDEHSGVPEDPS